MFLFFSFSIEAQNKANERTNSIKASDSNKELKQSKKPNKVVQPQEKNTV